MLYDIYLKDAGDDKEKCASILCRITHETKDKTLKRINNLENESFLIVHNAPSEQVAEIIQELSEIGATAMVKSQGQEVKPETAAVPTDRKAAVNKVIAYVSLAVIFISLIVIFIYSPGNSKKKKDSDVWFCAKNAVEHNLKSPSSAKFCSYDEATIKDKGNNQFIVTGWVDAENSFGAKIRTDFTVRLTMTESGYKDAQCYFNDDALYAVAEDIISEANEPNPTDEVSEEEQTYRIAIANFYNGFYLDALNEFKRCRGYEDSDTYISETEEKLYSLACEAAEKDEYESAIEMFSAIKKYKDSESKIVPLQDKLYFSQAKDFYEKEEYKQALDGLAGMSAATDEVIGLRDKIYMGSANQYYHNGQLKSTLRVIEKMEIKTDEAIQIEKDVNAFIEKYKKWLGKWGYRQNNSDWSLWIRAVWKDGLQLGFETGKTTAGETIIYDLYQDNGNSMVYHSEQFSVYEYTTIDYISEEQIETITHTTINGKSEACGKSKLMYKIKEDY